MKLGQKGEVLLNINQADLILLIKTFDFPTEFDKAEGLMGLNWW